MAGFDKVDPANPCFRCSASRIRAVTRPRMTAEWISNLVEKCRRPRWTKEVRWSENTPCKTEPERQADARADVMTGDRRASSARSAGKDIPQFAPNFTVYVLPPDVVCLYSEDRKFFLHGELYCALASAIGKGGKSLPRARSRAGAEFSARQDRGSPQAADRAPLHRPGIAPLPPAPWPAIGRASACRREWPSKISRIVACAFESIDVKGAAEFGAALSELGVHVVKRSPDLTVTLVNDYLERRLAELNQQRVSDRTPWLLVQPSGAFPLVGPVFSPGRRRLLDLPVRSHDPEPGGQGISRPRTGARRRGFTARPQHARTKRHPVCRPRNRQGDRHRLSHRVERSHRQPRSVGRDHREALRGGPPAMSDLRPQEAAEPAPRAGADRAWPRRQAGHDQRRIPDRVVAGHGGTLSASM